MDPSLKSMLIASHLYVYANYRVTKQLCMETFLVLTEQRMTVFAESSAAGASAAE